MQPKGQDRAFGFFPGLCSKRSSPSLLRWGLVGASALLLANCANQTTASNGGIDPKYGVSPSPRVVAEGEPVPKGGGRELVGKPYTVAGRTYVPRENPRYAAEGLASWYGTQFHGRLTANGEVFDRYSISAAHTTMPIPSYARVTNLRNKRSIIVRVNDRGPYHANRVMDVSQRVAEALDFKRIGTAHVRVEYVGRASLKGSDDRILMSSLRTDGLPASVPGNATPILVASSEILLPLSQPGGAERPVAESAVNPEKRQEKVASLRLRDTLAPDADAGTTGGALAYASGVPLPPERPFELAALAGSLKTAHHEAKAIQAVSAPPAAQPKPRPVVAGLFYAEPDTVKTTFRKDNPFNDLKPQRFVALKTQR